MKKKRRNPIAIPNQNTLSKYWHMPFTKQREELEKIRKAQMKHVLKNKK